KHDRRAYAAPLAGPKFMLTTRGWWFLIVVLLVLVLGAFALPYYTVTPVILALTLLAWFAVEWVLFHLRLNSAVSRLKCRRRIVQGGRDVPMVWSGLSFEVHVTIGHDGKARIPFAVYQDRLPSIADLEDGDPEHAGEIRPEQAHELTYTLRCPSPGILRFEGVKVRVADLHGFFYHRTFLRDPAEYYVLPPLSDDEGKQRADKRFNTLPPPGIHRFRRPGSGSELLDLRDYRPGDPPKMIAWKASARRDRLITKEYESDVPVRCVLFLDTSEAVRLGPPGFTPVARMANVASAVSQASAGNRDIIGLTTFDEHESQAITPARTKLHMINVMRRLAEVSSLQPTTKGVPAEQLVRRAYPLAQELYPDLMAKRVNSMPLGRLWVPLLDSRWGWIALMFVILSLPFATACIWTGFVAEQAEWLQPVLKPVAAASKAWVANAFEVAARATPRSWATGVRIIASLWLLVVLLLLPAALALIFWFIYGARGWIGRRKRELTQRKQLCALLAAQDGSGAAGIERLIHDDVVFSQRVGQFLQAHQYRCPVPLYDDAGRYRFRCETKTRALADAMVRAVSRARDNELYVILADLAELGDDLTPLVKATRLARARKHHVMILVPWPAEVPSPDETESPNGDASENGDGRVWEPPKKKKAKKVKPTTEAARAAILAPIVMFNLTKQYHESFRHMRKTLSGVGATVLRVNEGDPVQLILDRLDRVRGMRSRR
ncbi:MAG TPA: DUF58 domain-containing protein, partial [Gemmataceae bacterium]|nr:DUF58 domain-containing protein [Gemmataceae bacterium]